MALCRRPGERCDVNTRHTAAPRRRCTSPTQVSLPNRLPSWTPWILRPLAWLFGIAATLVLVVAALVAVALAVLSFVVVPAAGGRAGSCIGGCYIRPGVASGMMSRLPMPE